MAAKRRKLRSLGRKRKTAPAMEGSTVSSNQANGEALDIDDAINAMEVGDTFVKVWSASPSSRGERMIRLSKDRLTLHVTYRKCLRSLDHKTINLKCVEEVRLGYKSEVWHHMGRKAPDKDVCLCLIVEGRDGPLNLIASSKRVAAMWMLGIQHLSEKIERLGVKQKQGMWVWEYFKRADKDKSENLSFKEVKKLLDQINFRASDAYINRLLKDVDVESDRVLSFQEFVEFFRKISWRPDIERIYKTYTNADLKLQAKELVRFFKESWDKDITVQKAEDLISELEPDPGYLEQKAMSVYGFIHLLLSDYGDVFDIKCRGIYQDMTHPLSHYFVASSHNTYLVEHQLYGDSSAEAYVRALDRGCRCVELDCWDGDDGEPVIYHGHTLTSKIKFEFVIETLKSYAFKSNRYPVILSIENHCDVDQQNKMARILKNVLGDWLLKKPIEDDETELPSPDALLGKFIVKGKKLPIQDAVSDESGGEVTDEDEAADMEDEDVKNKSKNRKKKIRLSKELSDLIVYTQSCHFKGVDDAREISFAHICSLKEDKAMKICSSEPVKFVSYNEHRLVRIYPKGTRTDSSNYNPIPLWNSGCQIVALNYQTIDHGMRMNLARFRDNGGCGYLLKPNYLLSKSNTFNPLASDNVNAIEINIRVISAQQLPKPENEKKGEIIDPYVKVSVAGCACDKQSKRTSTVKNNGFNPAWEDEELDFLVRRPQLAIITFAVYDDDVASRDENIGKYSLPVSCLGRGYRHIHIETKKAECLRPASVFVHITINDLEDT